MQYKLLKNGIDSAPMTTDRGIDLLAFEPNTRRTVSIQVKAATHREPGAAEWISWSMPKECTAEYVAVVDLERDKGWLFSKEEFEKFAVGKGKGKWLWWYLSKNRPQKAKSLPEEHFLKYDIDSVIRAMFSEQES